MTRPAGGRERDRRAGPAQAVKKASARPRERVEKQGNKGKKADERQAYQKGNFLRFRAENLVLTHEETRARPLRRIYRPRACLWRPCGIYSTFGSLSVHLSVYFTSFPSCSPPFHYFASSLEIWIDFLTVRTGTGIPGDSRACLLKCAAYRSPTAPSASRPRCRGAARCRRRSRASPR